MIRELRLEDLVEFKELCNNYKKNFFELYNIEQIINSNFQKVYLSVSNKQIEGFILIEKIYETLSILHIFIKPESRNKKKASALLEYVLSDKNIYNTILEVNVNNEKAINLYNKFDFKIINTRKKYYNGEDAFVMERRIKNE